MPLKRSGLRIARPGLVVVCTVLCLSAAKAVNFHVATAQDLQNALTTAAANGADNVIYLTNGYYLGNFNFNSASVKSLTLQGEPGTTNTQITIDGGGGGISMSLSASSDANFTAQGLTFIRNGFTGLRIGTGGGGSVLAQDCRFISASGASGTGLEIASGQSAQVHRCLVVGASNGKGIIVNNVTGDAVVQECIISTNWSNYGDFASGLYASVGGVLILVSNTLAGNTGRGWAVCGGTAVVISGNALTGNSTSPYDSGASFGGSTLVVSNNTVSGNSGGDVVNAGAYSVSAISGNSVVGNSGTGLVVLNYWGGTASVTRNDFSRNTGYGAIISGGAAVSGNNFSDNANYGLLIAGSSSNRVCANSFTGNQGGVQCSASELEFVGNTVRGNSSTGNGGGLYCHVSYLSISNNTFVGNSGGGSGGGICCGLAEQYYDPATVSLVASGNVIRQNTAGNSGGGLYASASSIQLFNNLIVGNSQAAAGSSGGGLWVNPTSTLDMINNTVTGNTAAGGGGGASFQVSGLSEVLHVYNNLVWGNAAGGNGGDVYLAGTGQRKEFEFNDVSAMYGVWDLSLNNLDADPQFFDPVNADYHLRSSSPCSGIGDNAAPSLPLIDLDGNPRTNIVTGTVDLGCYQFNNSSFHPADLNSDGMVSGDEFTAYAAAWKNSQSWNRGPNPIPADFVTRAGFLLQNGGAYHNDGSAQPTCWKP